MKKNNYMVFKTLETLYLQAYDELLVSIALVDETFHIGYANHSFLKMFAYTLEEIYKKSLYDFFVHSNDFQALEAMKDDVFIQDVYLTRSDGLRICVKMKVQKKIFSNKECFLISFIDISSTIQESAKDALTGAYTKYTLENDFYNLLRKDGVNHYGAIFVDIDNFKKINDTLGHQFGDKVIQNIAIILKNSIRKNDLLFRWGGDEFLIFLSNVTRDKTRSIAENIRRKINEMEIDSYDGFTCSFGVDTIAARDALDEIILRIDQALLAAKKYSKNCVVEYKKG